MLLPANAQEVSVTLTVNQADLALVSKGLGGLPFAEVAPLMNKLQTQVMEQQKAKAAPIVPTAPIEPPK
jgi:hypothetical protein